MVGNQIVVRSDEKGARAAGGVENLQLGDLLRSLVFTELADRIPDDVLDDIGRRVIDTAGLLDFRFFLDLCLMTGSETNDFAEELFVYLAENFCRHDGKLIRAFWIVKAVNDVLQDFVINLEFESEFIRSFRPLLFRAKVEEAGVIPIVRLVVEMPKAIVNVLTVEQSLKLRVGLDTAILADAQEDDPVDGPLHGEVQFVDVQASIPHRQIAGQRVTPLLDLGEKLGIHRRCPALSPRNRILVEGPLEDSVLGEFRGDLVPACEVVLIRQVQSTTDARFIVGTWPGETLVNCELLEVRQDRERQLGRPCVALELIRRIGVVLDVDGRLLGFQKELARAADPETVIRCADLDRVFVDNIFVRLSMAGLVGDVPAESFEERIDELLSNLGLVVSLTAVRLGVLLESLNQVSDD